MYFYDKNTNGFYTPDIHTHLFIDNTPIGEIESAVNISNEKYHNLFELQSKGYTIRADENGNPVAIKTEPSVELIMENFEILLQNYLDTKAKEYGYDNIYSAISYAEEPSVPKFQTEGKAFRVWRSLFWSKVNEIKNQVLAGERDIPSAEEIISVSPVLDLPLNSST